MIVGHFWCVIVVVVVVVVVVFAAAAAAAAVDCASPIGIFSSPSAVCQNRFRCCMSVCVCVCIIECAFCPNPP